MTPQRFLFALALPFAIVAGAAEPAPATPPAKVRLVEVRAEPTARLVAGTVVAVQRATLSTRIGAAVERVHATEGSRVKAGALLVSLADRDLRGQLSATEAAFATASAHEKRIRSLLAQSASTPAELEQAEAQRAGAEAALASARANLAYSEIRAPFDGVVQSKRVNAGDFVGPGQPLLELEGTGGLEIQATLSEAEAAGVDMGDRLSFEARSSRGWAEVTALATAGDPASHRVSLRARLREGGAGLRSGTFARLAVPGARSEGVFVPRKAVVERGDLTGVLVAEEGRARLRWVALGEPAGDRVAVRAGLRPGEAVIEDPGTLRDGELIEVRHER